MDADTPRALKRSVSADPVFELSIGTGGGPWDGLREMRGVRLAIGATPSALLARILKEGAVIGVSGIAAGMIGGLILARVISRFITGIEIPGAVPLIGAAAVLIAAAVLASMAPVTVGAPPTPL